MLNRVPPALNATGHALTFVGAWPGRVAVWLFLPMLLAVLVVVFGSLLRLHDIVHWGTSFALVGDGLTLTSLSELQWHFLSVMVMLGIPYTLAQGRHVHVDVISSLFSPRMTAAVTLVGDVVFLMPFAWVVASYSFDFTAFAFKTSEMSNNGGLTDRWMIKAFLPLGMGMLMIVSLGRICLALETLITGAPLPLASNFGERHE